ncbi:MAG: plasmid pRiA4b ORF-3 family protein [Xanthobacteraceae bacterium]
MATTDEIAILRIELQGIEPLIWRRVAVSTKMSLMEVHRVIQEAMGWLNSHLWNFEVNSRKFGMRLSDDDDWNERVENAETITLAELLHAGERRSKLMVFTF